jgi:hypothetical protein
MKGGERFFLRYRIVAHDGAPDPATLNKLADTFGR